MRVDHAEQRAAGWIDRDTTVGQIAPCFTRAKGSCILGFVATGLVDLRGIMGQHHQRQSMDRLQSSLVGTVCECLGRHAVMIPEPLGSAPQGTGLLACGFVEPLQEHRCRLTQAYPKSVIRKIARTPQRLDQFTRIQRCIRKQHGRMRALSRALCTHLRLPRSMTHTRSPASEIRGLLVCPSPILVQSILLGIGEGQSEIAVKMRGRGR